MNASSPAEAKLKLALCGFVVWVNCSGQIEGGNPSGNW